MQALVGKHLPIFRHYPADSSETALLHQHASEILLALSRSRLGHSRAAWREDGGDDRLQPKPEPAINFSITLAALLPQKVHLVATLSCCDVSRHTHSWLTAQRGIFSQQLGMAHGNSHQAPRFRERTHPKYPSTVPGQSYSHGQVARHFRAGLTYQAG